MKDEFITRVGVLGQRHYNYLKKHFPKQKILRLSACCRDNPYQPL